MNIGDKRTVPLWSPRGTVQSIYTTITGLCMKVQGSSVNRVTVKLIFKEI